MVDKKKKNNKNKNTIELFKLIFYMVICLFYDKSKEKTLPHNGNVVIKYQITSHILLYFNTLMYIIMLISKHLRPNTVT